MKTILVIEDQPVLASAYRNKFTGEGFNVEVAHDGEQGLDLITRIRPDLVLLDMHLPKLSGIEILRQVRSNSELQALPIIVFSNLTKPGAVEEAWQAGATMVLSKLNTSPNRVLESVKTTLAASGASLGAVSLPTDDAPVSTMIDSAHNSQATRGHILLVEDHPDLGALLVFLLQRAGHQVTNVKTPAEALQQVSEQSFDLFVLGRNCADRAVLPLSTQIRQSRPDKPIIVYSTAALFSEQQDGLKAGATAYLAKPEDLFNVGQIASDLIKNQARPVTRHIRAA